MNNRLNESIKQIGLILIIVFLFCLIVDNLRYFAGSILGAFTLYMILREPHRWLLKKKWNKALATLVLLAAAFLFLSLIMGGLAGLTFVKLQNFDFRFISDSFYHIRDWLIQEWNYDIFSENILQKGLLALGNILPAILSATGSVVMNIVMMIFVLFFMLQQSSQFEKELENALPVSRESIQLLKHETRNMVLSNAVGIPLIMLGQGLTATLAYWLLDAGDPVAWGIFTGVLGPIPVIGAALIWVPLAINLFIGGHIWQGIILLIVGAGIISQIDSLIRMVFLKKKANVHPLITVFGIILGMSLFGFWGIIFGPLVISGFLLLIKIYRVEFLRSER